MGDLYTCDNNCHNSPGSLSTTACTIAHSIHQKTHRHTITQPLKQKSFYAKRLKKGLLLIILRCKKVTFLEFLRKAIKKDSPLRIFTL